MTFVTCSKKKEKENALILLEVVKIFYHSSNIL